MSRTTFEEVLCTPVSDLPAVWLPEAGAVCLEEGALLAGLSGTVPIWRQRDQVEDDCTFKQWITYAIVQNRAGEILGYSRHGAEKRLHGSLSIGIGGHINPEDDENVLVGEKRWRYLFHSGMMRELSEEYPGVTEGTPRFVGIVHESKSKVGRTHIGLVFVYQLELDPGNPGPELKNHFWIKERALHSLALNNKRFELWSRLALRFLGDGKRA